MANPFVFIVYIAILIFSVVAHEVAHGYMALYLGDPTARLAGRLTINPLKHLDPLGSFLVPLASLLIFGVPFGWARPVPYNPYNLRNQRWGDALVAIAGPATNLLIAIVFSVLFRMSTSGTVGAAELFADIVKVNLSLMLFNLVPVPPLDGFKIFTSFLSARHSKLVYDLERYGFIIVAVFVFFFADKLSPIFDALQRFFLG